MEGLIYGGKFAFQKEVYRFCFVLLCIFVTEDNFLSTSPPGRAYTWRGVLTECFLRYCFTLTVFFQTDLCSTTTANKAFIQHRNRISFVVVHSAVHRTVLRLSCSRSTEPVLKSATVFFFQF